MRSFFFALATLALLAGCGWQLRGSQVQEGPLPRIAVVSDDSYSPMVRMLREAGEQRSGDESLSGPLYTIHIIKEIVDRRAVTYTASGAPAQYEMTLQLTYSVRGNGGAEETLPRTIATHRLFDFDPRNVVAKSEEERVLLQQMRQQLAQQLLGDIRRRHNLGESATSEEQVQPDRVLQE